MSGTHGSTGSATSTTRKTYTRAKIIRMSLGSLAMIATLVFIFSYIVSDEKTSWSKGTSENTQTEKEEQKVITQGQNYDMSQTPIGEVRPISVPKYTSITVTGFGTNPPELNSDGNLDGQGTCGGDPFIISSAQKEIRITICNTYSITNTTKFDCQLFARKTN